MRKKIFTSIIACAFLSINLLQAQLILVEDFDYDAGRALVADAISGSDNYDGVTGWATQQNSMAGDNCFNITDGPLYYNGYVASGIGNAMKYTGEAGQGVFKIFEKGIKNDSTVYISFMINFPSTEIITGGDYFLGIKMEPQASSTNWGGRLFAQVDPGYPGEEVTLGINKMSAGTTTWVNSNSGPFFPANTTHLMVVKYYIGTLNGTNVTEETGNYDDVMSLYVNPPLDGTEPAEPILIHRDPNQKDIYRYTESGSIMGSARGLYFRSSALGNAPAFTIDGIRVGTKWEEVIPASTGLKNTTNNNFSHYVDDSKQIIVTASNFNYSTYELVSLSGQKVMSGSLKDDNNRIDASSLTAGVYILNLQGAQRGSAKIMIK